MNEVKAAKRTQTEAVDELTRLTVDRSHTLLGLAPTPEPQGYLEEASDRFSADEDECFGSVPERC